jgi:hypothetical protein
LKSNRDWQYSVVGSVGIAEGVAVYPSGAEAVEKGEGKLVLVGGGAEAVEVGEVKVVLALVVAVVVSVGVGVSFVVGVDFGVVLGVVFLFFGVFPAACGEREVSASHSTGAAAGTGEIGLA